MDKKPTVYVTKYALTEGIIKLGGDQYKQGRFDPCRIIPTGRGFGYTAFHPKEYFTSKDDAISDAIARREKKMASLKKQITKLESMTF